TANQIYRHNFPDTTLWNKTIEGITLDDFDKLPVDMIVMSPPCQPFTRQRLVETLVECGYTFQETMISPTSVGIPNSRLRYFLTAKLSTPRPLSLRVPSACASPHL
uniref:Uncharacterized protein n=1 Tax=Gasterosteus aculeatus aculeatus TaxID=481459 RepID=A0AAQ4P7E8_GASAC